MRTRSIAALAALVLFFPAASASAQCTAKLSPAGCWRMIVPATPAAQAAAAPAQASATAQQTVAAANTGVTSLVSPASSALQDFLSLFSASLESSSLTSDGNALTFDWNPRFGNDQPLKIEAVFTQPELSSAAVTAFGSNAAALTAEKDALTNADDVTVSATYSPVTAGFGRSIAPHRAYFESLVSTVFTQETARADDAMFQALQQAGVTTTNFNRPIEETVTDATQQQTLIAAIETAARAHKNTAQVVDGLTRSFAKLLNNQPQPYASLLYHERKNVVGPSEVVLKATYEYGFRNLNTFQRRYGRQCDPLLVAQADGAARQSCIDLLTAYAGNGGPDETGDGGRVSFSLEYHEAGDVHVDLPQYSVQYDIASGSSLVGSITGGWILAPRPDRRSGRLDLSVSYENIRNAAVFTGTGTPPADVDDRLIASITYTQKLTDTISIPVALIYANHAAYLSNVDRKLNAHFGVQYKLPTK